MWRWPNGARLRFAYLERDADAYQGHSYTRVYVEELGTFPSASPVLRLMATLRSGEGVPCGFRATGNPGGPGHQWVKARYIDPNPAGCEIRKFTYENPWTRATIEQDRVFIPSKLQDNKFLGPEYVANLQMVGSDTLVRAPIRIAFRQRNDVGARDKVLSRLNGWPVRSPVNASLMPSRATAHDSGSMRFATPPS
jgi:hypothetical protein